MLKFVRKIFKSNRSFWKAEAAATTFEKLWLRSCVDRALLEARLADVRWELATQKIVSELLTGNCFDQDSAQEEAEYQTSCGEEAQASEDAWRFYHELQEEYEVKYCY